MPRRDVVLTGLIAFGAGVAVGANWGKLRKKIGPLLEKLGLQMADLGDFLSASGLEEFAPEVMEAEVKSPRPRARRNKAKVPATDAFMPQASRRNGRNAGSPTVRPFPRRKTSRRKPVVARKEEEPLATGTFGD
jgi:hypothetical protein